MAGAAPTLPGFLVDLESGEILTAAPTDWPTHHGVRRIENLVWLPATQNLLLVRLPARSSGGSGLEATLQYAFNAAWSSCSNWKNRNSARSALAKATTVRMLFFEAGEGGAGVLRRLVDEADAVARVARRGTGALPFR